MCRRSLASSFLTLGLLLLSSALAAKKISHSAKVKTTSTTSTTTTSTTTTTTVAPSVVPELPSYLKICHRSDPELNECIKQSVNEIRPYLSDGIPELDVPPCEPLHLSEIEISQATGPVAIRSIYHNIKIWGGTDFVLRSIKIDIEKDRVRLKLYIPRLEMQSEYKMDGKILMLPIVGEGDAFGNFTDIDVVAVIQGERYYDKKDKKLHFRVTDFQCDFELGYASIYLDNLFNGDEILADAMNLFLNDNWRAVAEEMKPGLEVSMSKLFKNFSNKFYQKYPIDTLLPP